MKNIFKLFIAFTILVSFNSCNRDYCKDIVCETGTICDDGLCITDVFQEVNVTVLLENKNAENRISIGCGLVSPIEKASVKLSDENIRFSKIYYIDSVFFDLSSYPNFEFEDFLGEMKFEMKLRGNTSNLEFQTNLDVDKIDIPVISYDTIGNEGLYLTFDSPFSSIVDYTEVIIESSHNNIYGYTTFFKSKITHSLNDTITNQTDGWVNQSNSFISGLYYRVTLVPTKIHSYKEKNVNYNVIIKSSKSFEFYWY